MTINALRKASNLVAVFKYGAQAMKGGSPVRQGATLATIREGCTSGNVAAHVFLHDGTRVATVDAQGEVTMLTERDVY